MLYHKIEPIKFENENYIKFHIYIYLPCRPLSQDQSLFL